jgi:hypothetical protein
MIRNRRSIGFEPAALLAIVALTCAGVSTGRAQIAEPPANATSATLGTETVFRYRFGAKVVAGDGAVENMKVLMAVPLVCPEQSVKLVDEEASPHVDAVEYRQTDEGVRQMVIIISQLAPRQEAHAYATFEVHTHTLVAPQATNSLTAPRRPPRSLRKYLAASPMIEVNHRKIRAAVDEALTASATDDATSDWKRVEALYSYALDHVRYELGDDKSAVQALGDAKGDCQAIAAAFVAMCRTNKIPARMVWVDGHQYAEFYLESADGQGNWYPVESAGTRAFGHMPLARVILQKGDNIRVPERRGERLRYASDYAVLPTQPAVQPAVTFVRTRLE